MSLCIAAGMIAGSPAVAPAQSEDMPKVPALKDYTELGLPADARASITSALQRRDYTLAENLLVQHIGRDPKSAQPLLFLARIFLIDNRPLNCAIALKKAERLQPLQEPERFMLALCYVRINRAEWAAAEFEQLARSNPRNALYPYWQGRLAYDRYEYPAAIAKFDQAVQLDPGLARAYDNLGLSHEAMSNDELAAKNYEQAVSLNRKDGTPSPWPPLNYARLLLKQGALEKAEPLLRDAVAYGPKLPQTHHQMGILLGKQKKYDEAVAELKTANELDPAYAESHYTLAHVYRQLGRNEAADSELRLFERLKQAALQGKTPSAPAGSTQP